MTSIAFSCSFFSQKKSMIFYWFYGSLHKSSCRDCACVYLQEKEQKMDLFLLGIIRKKDEE